MADLNYERVLLSGLKPTPVPADAAGDVVPANSNGFAMVTNGGASSITVTIPTPGKTRFGLAQPDVTVVVPAGEQRFVGPLVYDLVDPDENAPNGVQIEYSSVASVTVAALLI